MRILKKFNLKLHVRYVLVLYLLHFTTFLFGQTLNEQLIDSMKSLIGSESIEQDIVLMREIGGRYQVLDFDSAMYYSRNSLRLAEEIDNDTLFAISSLELGGVFMYAQQLDSAVRYFDIANRSFRALDHKKGISYTLHNMAIIYLRKGNYDKSLELALESLERNEEEGLRTWAANNLIGIIHYENHEWDKALDYFEESLKEARSKSDTIISSNGIANAYRAKGNLELSEKYILETIAYGRILGDKTGLGVYLNNYGELLRELGKLEEAEKQFKESISIRLGLQNMTGAATGLSELAGVYSDQGSYVRADSCIKKALDILNEDGSIPSKIEILGHAYEIHSKFRKYKSALTYFEEYQDLRDSVYNKEKAELIADMDAKYQTAKKQAEIEQKESEILLLEKDRELANTRSLVLGIVCILIIAGVILLYRQAKTRRALTKAELDLANEQEAKLRAEIDYKDKELVNFALQISSKDEFMENLKDEVKELNKKSDATLKPLLNMIKSNASLANDRENFDRYVQNVCEGFFVRLNQKYPDISQGEEKLAALIRLGLSSKEIASVINISPKSVDMSRYRLRKKMSLDGESNLTEVLQSV